MWELDSKGRRLSFADPNFEDIRAQTEMLQGIAQMRSSERTVSTADQPENYVLASEGYFEALGIPLRSGRLFSDTAGPNMPHEAVISESVAQQTWPTQDPLGKTIEFGNMDGDLRLLTIVGVVGEVRNNLELEPRPTIYVNYRQRPRTIDLFDITMRSSSDPSVLLGAVRGVLRQTDPNIPPRINTFTCFMLAALLF